jgi:hypothetical protein
MEMRWTLTVKQLQDRHVVLEGKSGEFFVPRQTVYIPSYLREGDTVRLENTVHFGRARLACQVVPAEITALPEDVNDPLCGPTQYLVVYEHNAPAIG